jgi:hypothetical protein
MTLDLTPYERAMLSGSEGDATAMAMRIVVSAAELLAAPRLVEIRSAHIDGCLHHGDGGVEFAERLAEGGGRVAVDTTLNVGALDLLHRVWCARTRRRPRWRDVRWTLMCAWERSRPSRVRPIRSVICLVWASRSPGVSRTRSRL